MHALGVTYVNCTVSIYRSTDGGQVYCLPRSISFLSCGRVIEGWDASTLGGAAAAVSLLESSKEHSRNQGDLGSGQDRPLGNTNTC